VKNIFFLIITGFLAYFAACSQDNVSKHENVKKSDLIIIDNRTLGEYNSGHIDGAILIPFDVIADKIKSVAKSKDAPIALYCRSGNRSGQALKTLESLGYTNVVNYGGISGAQQTLNKKK
jgi:phage shock protein E